MINKKGDVTTTLSVMFKIVIVVLVGGVLLGNTYRISQAEIYTLKALAVDLGLQIDAMQSLKYDSTSFIAFSFPFETNVVILPNTVKLSRERLHVEYFFKEDPNIKIKYDHFNNIKRLYLIKNSDTLSFSISEPDFFPSIYCPKEDLNLQLITFDPGKGYDEYSKEGSQGKIIKGKPESLHILDIAALLSFEPNFDFTRIVKTTDLTDSFVSIEQRKSKVADALISVHVGTTENIIKAYINPKKQSTVLACNILNKLIKYLKPENTAIIPVNFDFLAKDDYKQVLDIDKPAVLFEIGSEKDKFILNKHKIVEAIKEGIKNV